MTVKYNIDEVSAGPGTQTQCFCMNASGQVSGDFFDGNATQGAVWLGPLTSPTAIPGDSILYGMNAAGDTVGVVNWSTGNEIAVLLRSGALTPLNGALGVGSVGVAINDAGVLTGGIRLAGADERAYLLGPDLTAAPTIVDPPGGVGSTYGLGINADGHVVGPWWPAARTNKGFAWAGGQFHDLGESAPTAINDAGVIAGDLFKPWPSSYQPALYNLGSSTPSWQEIPIPAGFAGAHGHGINNSGDVVGNCWIDGTTYVNGPWSAYIYSGGVSKDLNDLISPDSGWHLEFASDINDAGQIVGTGTYQGRPTSFLLTPRPAVLIPPTFWEMLRIIFGVIQDGGGLTTGGPIPPSGPLDERLTAALLLEQVAMAVGDQRVELEIRRQALHLARQRLESQLAALDMAARPWPVSVRAPVSARPALSIWSYLRDRSGITQV